MDGRPFITYDFVVVAETADRVVVMRDGGVVEQNISLTLKRGETLGLVGESGSGKSAVAAASCA